MLRENSYKARHSFVIVVENTGNHPARSVRILMGEKPAGIKVDPKVAVATDSTVDGSFSYILDSIAPRSSVSISFFEAHKYKLQGVFFDGHSINEVIASRPGPYDPQRKYTFFALTIAFLAGTWFQLGAGFVYDFLEQSASGESGAHTIPGEVPSLPYEAEGAPRPNSVEDAGRAPARPQGWRFCNRVPRAIVSMVWQP